MRGKLSPLLVESPAGRITPAGAGKTCTMIIAQSLRRDHPRRCGENCRKAYQRTAYRGSPPQVRGKRRAPRTRADVPEDHPRRCGENPHKPRMKSSVKGSPPQVRGKPVFSTIFSASVRITPAGAGKTRACKRTDGSYRDHPRRCGENRAVIAALNSSLGSPPQVRGKLRGHLSAVKQNGITPAGAGKTAAIRQLLQAN